MYKTGLIGDVSVTATLALVSVNWTICGSNRAVHLLKCHLANNKLKGFHQLADGDIPAGVRGCEIKLQYPSKWPLRGDCTQPKIEWIYVPKTLTEIMQFYLTTIGSFVYMTDTTFRLLKLCPNIQEFSSHKMTYLWKVGSKPHQELKVWATKTHCSKLMW